MKTTRTEETAERAASMYKRKIRNKRLRGDFSPLLDVAQEAENLKEQIDDAVGADPMKHCQCERRAG